MAEVYLSSFRTALPNVRLAHSDDEVRGWIREVVIPLREAWVAEAPDGGIVGMMVLTERDLDQLYIQPSWLGRGIGGRLVDLAKARRPNGLGLWTFQVNERAWRFYERHGFRRVKATAGDNEEREPDYRYEWRPG